MRFWDDIIVAFAYANPHYESIGFLKDLYRFPWVTFYGPVESEAPEEVHLIDHGQGSCLYRIMLDLFDRFDARGYLVVHDDFLLNPFMLERLDKSKLWHQKPRRACGEGSWNWWEDAKIRASFFNAHRSLPSKYQNKMPYYGFADFSYIPREFKPQVSEVYHVFSKYGTFLEIATPYTVLYVIPESDRQVIDSVDHVQWENFDREWQELYKPTLHGIHPVKFSIRENRIRASRFIQGISP
jgi:hypothetical protein